MIDIPDFVNRSHEINKRNAARRARCFRKRLESVLVALVKLGLAVGILMDLAACFIIDAAEPNAPIPWGLIIAGALLAGINYYILMNIID